MRKLILVLLAVVCFGLAGCASAGREMSQSQISQIKPNQTTKAEMMSIFGPPLSHGYDSSGKMMMTWHYSHVGAFGTNMRQQVLSALINEQDIVEKYTITDNNDAGPRMGR